MGVVHGLPQPGSRLAGGIRSISDRYAFLANTQFVSRDTGGDECDEQCARGYPVNQMCGEGQEMECLRPNDSDTYDPYRYQGKADEGREHGSEGENIPIDKVYPDRKDQAGDGW